MSRVVDTILKKQLDRAGRDGTVGAVFTLRDKDGEPRDPDETDRVVAELLRAAREKTAAEPVRFSVFANVQSFAVAAPARFIESLIESDEIVSAVANEQEEDMAIPPVSARPAKLPHRSAKKQP